MNKKGKKILVSVDEVQNDNEMKEFIKAYQLLLREDCSIFLVMTGLYENISLLQDNKSLNFLYRAPKIYLGPLSISTISFNYQKYLGVDESLALKMAKLTKGYAYAYQVLGYLFSKHDCIDITNDLLLEFDQYLKDYVYDKVFFSLSKKEQDILTYFVNDSDYSGSYLRAKAKMDIKAFSAYRDRLIKQGVICSRSYGFHSLALPRFTDYLKHSLI